MKVKDIEKTSITLEWQPPKSDGGSPLTGYVIEKKEASRPSWSRVERIHPDQTTLNVKNLIEKGNYQFRVIAENRHGAGEPLATETTVTPKSKFGN